MTAKRSWTILGMIYIFFFMIFVTYFIPAIYPGPYALGIVQVLMILTASITLIKYFKTFLRKKTLSGVALVAGYSLTIAGLLYLTFIWTFAMIIF